MWDQIERWVSMGELLVWLAGIYLAAILAEAAMDYWEKRRESKLGS